MYSRSEALSKIEGQRRAIREHIDKYNRYEVDYDKAYALKTIERCQDEIQNIKNKCESDIPDSYEDYWRP